MAKLTASARDRLKRTQFADPEAEKYPVENKAHARAAKGRAAEMHGRGKISAAKESEIDRNADRVLGKGEPARKQRPVRVHGLSHTALREHGLHTSRHFQAPGCGSSDAED